MKAHKNLMAFVNAGPLEEGPYRGLFAGKPLYWDSTGSITAETTDGQRYALWPDQAVLYLEARLAGAETVAIGKHVYVC